MRKRRNAVWAVVMVVAIALGCMPGAKAAGSMQGDSLEVSLLTCSPGDAIYELYGHSAIRVREKGGGSDWVFNYGMFDFRTPHFAWRFMRGETDYFLAAQPFASFIASYRKQGRGVTAQVLNLTAEEKLRLAASLARTASLEGWTYRYNFLYDNCTTRAVDEVEDCLGGSGLEWPTNLADGRTQRDVIHEFAAVSPWARFGQDLILGSEIDHPADIRELMFSPIYAELLLAGAKRVDANGSNSPLVAATVELLKPDASRRAGGTALSPMVAAVVLFLAVGALSWRDMKRSRLSPWVDIPMMLLQGGAGCVVLMLFAFSAHPAVGSNWLVLLLNPLPLLYAPFKRLFDKRGAGRYYYWIMLIVILLIVVLAACGVQALPPELYVLFAAYVVRSAVGISVLRARGVSGKSFIIKEETRNTDRVVKK